MPRVLHLFNIFGALTERAMFDYTLGLSRAGVDVAVACESIAPETPEHNLPITILKRIEVEPTSNVAGQTRDISTNIADPALLNLLRKPFDLIHGHFGPRLLHAVPWIQRRTPVIISTYGYDVGRLLRDSTWIERYKWAAEQGVIFVTLAESMEGKLLEHGVPAQNIRRIHLGIDLEAHRFNPSPAPVNPRFVFIGRFVEKKGAGVLIDAMGRLVQDHGIDATLDLIGAGPNESVLRSQVARANLSRHVNFLGVLPFAKLFDQLHDCTALVQPSQTASDGDAEGAPMVLMSAQAAGVPCITTRHSGNPETIPPNGQAFLVPERDPAALADAMRAMINQPVRERSALQGAGRQWIEQRYDLEKTIAHYAALYRELT